MNTTIVCVSRTLFARLANHVDRVHTINPNLEPAQIQARIVRYQNTGRKYIFSDSLNLYFEEVPSELQPSVSLSSGLLEITK